MGAVKLVALTCFTMAQERKPIPKFASFKPPPAPPSAPDRPSERRTHDSERRERSRHHEKRHSRHRSHRERSRSRERRRERREGRSSREDVEPRAQEPRPEHRSTPTSTVKQPADDASALYIIDRKGDRYNIIYGTIHRYSVPRYHRVGQGSVLGLPPNYKIDRDTVEGDAIVVSPNTWRPDASRTGTKSILSGMSRERSRLLRVRPTSLLESAADASKDYLPLDDRRSRKRRKVLGDSDSDNEKHAYRSILGKAKPDEDIPSDLEAVSDSGDEGGRYDPDEEIKQRNVELSRNIEQTPNDVGCWLQLIDYQETLLKGAERETSRLTYAERKSLADIKLSLYDKALKRVGAAPSRDRLILGRLEEGAQLWDTKKLASQWQATLKANSQFISLWVKYLDFRQTHFLDFTYERCLSTFVDCLKLNRSAPDHPQKAQIQVYLFLRLTSFIRESGFTEHAIGLWQSIFELAFYRPDSLDVNDEERLMSAFLEFWESETARFGDIGAKGWKSGFNTVPSPKFFTPQFQLDLRAMFASWVVCERERIVEARLPARSLDESDLDDPYRVIIASDLEEILPLVWNMHSTQELIDGFLCFCHLPPLMSSINLETTSKWSGDSFLRNDLMSSPDTTLDHWIPTIRSDTERSPVSPVSFHHQNFIHGGDTLFAGEKWFSSLKAWRHITLETRSDIDPDWVRRSLRLLVDASPGDEQLAEYVVAVEFACNPKEAKKYAKSLLKKRPSSLRLYNAYALMERRSGNQAAADHVWATSLSMSKTFSESSSVESVYLWRTWIWELLEERNIAHASHLLISMPHHSVDLKDLPGTSDQPMFSPTSLLKIQSYLAETQEIILANRKSHAFAAWSDCYAILLYLTHSQDLVKALEAYDGAISRVGTLPAQDRLYQSFTTELLHQARARFLYYHVRTSSMYKSTHIRSLLADSIQLFPHNTMFLCLFTWNESRFRIEERVRDTIRDITETKRHPEESLTMTQVPVTTHLFSIYTELLRPEYAGSTLHSVRAAFEKAIGEQSTGATNTIMSTTRSSLTLWKLYILFELWRGNIARAKDVFYRAMRACPWSKELPMLAFTHLRADVVRERHPTASGRDEGMGFDELRHVYNVLVEKELRIHIDIEEELEEMASKMTHKSAALGMPITMPEDALSEDEQMQE